MLSFLFLPRRHRAPESLLPGLVIILQQVFPSFWYEFHQEVHNSLSTSEVRLAQKEIHKKMLYLFQTDYCII